MENTVLSPYAERGRYLTLDQGFNQALPPVPAHIFLAERDQALGPGGSAHILCDQSAEIAARTPSTTPLLLASYVRLAPGQPLTLSSGGSAEVFYVIRGAGSTEWGDGERIDWQAGDAMLLPGGSQERHTATGDGNAVLWRVTNQPQLAYESALPPPVEASPIKAVHYRGPEMMKALIDVRQHVMKSGMKSMAIMFGSEGSAYNRIAPSLTLALNAVPPHDHQIPHRHNSVAVSLVLRGEKAFSLVDGKRVDWSPYATFVTPAGASHTHHNESDQDSIVLIVQDGGLYYHCRTMGFAITGE
ncbi:hypothetical protein GCM10023144_09080 [Pigmentiphaga soli]|uniref:Cupin type-2 domain-containing protein n=1 Tax=Pigmentiphaga soli TaxID=1007095 RepID=A0ABP8GKI8_9BURK